MRKVNFKKHPVSLKGNLPETGKPAPSFNLVKSDLATLSLEDLKGKTLVLNIFPSLDTGVCATSVRKFNQLASNMKDTLVLAISRDLPFAHSRFCTVEG
ncbi:MAG: thiol peroxidase, partial [Bacteroidales bacterium]|nr:thiol peroxidase [Bacteroidales bacterium]